VSTHAADREFPRQFLPAELDLGDWDAVQPFVERLLESEIDSVADLEQWLLDASELQAAISEGRRNLP